MPGHLGNTCWCQRLAAGLPFRARARCCPRCRTCRTAGHTRGRARGMRDGCPEWMASLSL
eukprot:8973413-Lingulodinium_polyedra.AAC.1